MKRNEEAKKFRQAQKKALKKMRESESNEDESSTTSDADTDAEAPNRDLGNIGDLPEPLERELRLLQRRTSGFIDIEVRPDQTFATIKYETGHD